MSSLRIEEISIDRTLVVKTKNGLNLTINGDNNYLGLWLQKSGLANIDSLSMYVSKNNPPAIQLWPSKEFGAKLPFAFSGAGLQIPMPKSDKVVVITLEEIAKWADSLKQD